MATVAPAPDDLLARTIEGYIFVGLPTRLHPYVELVSATSIVLRTAVARPFVLGVLEKWYGHPPGQFLHDPINIMIKLKEGLTLQRAGGHKGLVHLGPLPLFEHIKGEPDVNIIPGALNKVVGMDSRLLISQKGGEHITKLEVDGNNSIELIIPRGLLTSEGFLEATSSIYTEVLINGEPLKRDYHLGLGTRLAKRLPEFDYEGDFPEMAQARSNAISWSDEPPIEILRQELECDQVYIQRYQEWLDGHMDILLDYQFKLDCLKQDYIKKSAKVASCPSPAPVHV